MLAKVLFLHFPHESAPSFASTFASMLPSRVKLYTPPPPTPISGHKAFFRGGGGGVYFEAPRGRNFIPPPPFYSQSLDLPLPHGLAPSETMVSDHGPRPPLSTENPTNKGFLGLGRPFLDLVSQTPRPRGRGRFLVADSYTPHPKRVFSGVEGGVYKIWPRIPGRQDRKHGHSHKK